MASIKIKPMSKKTIETVGDGGFTVNEMAGLHGQVDRSYRAWLKRRGLEPEISRNISYGKHRTLKKSR